MDRLGEEHIKFLRACAANPWKRQESSLPIEELNQMVKEGLLIPYGNMTRSYAITKVGSQVAKSFGDSDELIKIAVEYVISKGYTEDVAKDIVKEHGAEHILKSKIEELKQISTGQREVKVPLDEQGKPTIKFRG